MKIIDATEDEILNRQMTEILLDGFSDTGTVAWSAMEECLEEVKDSLAKGKISRIAVDENEQVLAWTIGAEVYEGYTWELELLVVRRDAKLTGIGRKMLEDFETQVLKRGGSVVFLGSDDENNRTSIGGIELYPNPLEHLANIKNLGGHPYEFYQKCGYAITGVIPHANGFGKPDIWLTKQISNEQIRQANPEEAKELTNIALSAKAYWGYPQRWLDLWQDDLTFTPEIIAENIVILMSVDDEILGFYKLIIENETADLEHLWIKPENIGKGVGKKLFAHAKQKAISLNTKIMTIKSDPNAEGFYAKMGARKIGDDVSELEGKERRLPLMKVDL